MRGLLFVFLSSVLLSPFGLLPSAFDLHLPDLLSLSELPTRIPTLPCSVLSAKVQTAELVKKKKNSHLLSVLLHKQHALRIASIQAKYNL